MSFPALVTAQDALKASQDELYSILNEAGPELDMDKVKSVPGESADKVDFIRKLNEKIDERGTEVDRLSVVAKAAERAAEYGKNREEGTENGHREPGTELEVKDFGELFTKSDAYTGKRGNQGPESHLDIGLKTLMETTVGWLPETTRTGRMVDFAVRPIQVTDVVPGTTTGQTAVVYMEETTYTNNAAEVAEGGTYAESALALTEKTSPVRKVGTWLPVTDEQLDDLSQVRGYLNNRLPFMLRSRLDTQILSGNGTAPNLRGILNTAGIQTVAKTAPVALADIIYTGIKNVRVTGRANPNAIIMHPDNFQTLRLLKTTDGLYVWGAPMDAGPYRIWGLPIVEADVMTVNTALVGDFGNFAELATRKGIDVQVTNTHGTHFVEGKQAIRCDVRVALIVYRPAAFCTVTALNL